MFFTTKPNARLHLQAKAWGLDGKIDNSDELARNVVEGGYTGRHMNAQTRLTDRKG